MNWEAGLDFISDYDGAKKIDPDKNNLDEELKSLKRLYEELKMIFDNSVDEIFVANGVGEVIMVNKICEEYYDTKTEDIIGKNVRELEKKQLYSPSMVKQVLQTKKRATAVQTTKKGYKLICTANPVFDDKGEVVMVVCNSRNVTELTNLQQRLEEKEKLMENYKEEINQLRNIYPRNIELIAESRLMKQTMEMVEKIAQTDLAVLLEGEAGVGKGVTAQKIHHLSKREENLFVVVNCATVSENLIEEELFGCILDPSGSESQKNRKGLVEMGDGGTLFLKEISSLSVNMQSKILQLIKENKFMPVGASSYKKADVRVIASTSKELYKMVQENDFREDLFYLLNTVSLTIPPLRQRRDDISALAEYFIKKNNEQFGTRKTICVDALNMFMKYVWPGNVRELENLLGKLMITSNTNVISINDLPEYLLLSPKKDRHKVILYDLCSLKEASEQLEKQLLEKAYNRYKNTYRMAEVLEINQSTVVRKMKRYLISS